VFSDRHVVCIGAGGLISHVAPTLCRKGIGALTILDDDEVEASNLNRQRFYASDIGKLKAIQMVRHLRRECIHATRLTGHAMRLQEAIGRGVDLRGDVAVCGVDNNPTRMLASRYFREHGIPVVFMAVSAQADHGYVFVQGADGPCLGCLFPDAVDDERYPCPGTPAMADILQVVGSLAVYGVDTCLMGRSREWTYRTINLTDGAWDSARMMRPNPGCSICGGGAHAAIEHPIDRCPPQL